MKVRKYLPVMLFVVIPLIFLSFVFADVIDNREEVNTDFDDIAVYYGDHDFGNKVYMCQRFIRKPDTYSESIKDSTNSYFLFLPYDTDTVGDYRLILPGNMRLMIDGTVYADDAVLPIGLATVPIKLIGHSGKTQSEGNLTVYYGNSLPSIFLITSRDDGKLIFTERYAELDAVLITTDIEGNQDMATSCKTGGRGGSSWEICPKRPLKINLPENMKLLGMTEARKYALLANYMDQTNMKNAIAFTAAGRFGMRFSPECRHVNLYVNGEYEGLYLLATRVNARGGCLGFDDDLDVANDIANNNMIGIPDSEIMYEGTRDEIKYSLLKNNPPDITGSYLLEFECEGKPQDENYEISWFTTPNQIITIDSPHYASKEETGYIAKYVREAEEAVYSDDGVNKSTGLSYRDYLDIDSWSRMCLLNNFLALQDYSGGSLFMYKNAGDDKLYCGPVWDYDKSLTDDFYSGKKFDYTDRTTLTGWYDELYRFDDVFENIRDEYVRELSPVIDDMLEDYVPSTIESISAAMEMDNARWSHEDGCEAARAKEAYEWLTNRKKLFDSVWIDGEPNEYADNVNHR